MSQEPSYTPPGDYTPPGGYTPPPSYPAAPPRQGKPWWIWLLAGCGGCALLMMIGIIIVAAMGVNAFSNLAKSVGPVTTASVQQALGADVPLYPGSTLDPTTTRAMLTTFKVGEQMTGKSLFRGIAALNTQDSAEKVFQFYDKKLKAGGWKPAQGQGRGGTEQRMYQKGKEMVLIQYQVGGQGPMIVIMRGGPDLVSQAPPVPTQ